MSEKIKTDRFKNTLFKETCFGLETNQPCLFITVDKSYSWHQLLVFRRKACYCALSSRRVICTGIKQTRVWTLPNKLKSRCSLRLWCCVGERGIVALMRVSFVTALPQCLSAPTLSWSCRGTAFPSRACASLCTRCSAGKSTQSSTASSRERGTLMCARRSWAPFGFSPSTCITPSSLTGKILLMPFHAAPVTLCTQQRVWTP